jgi:signal transduction histidine kinase
MKNWSNNLDFSMIEPQPEPVGDSMSKAKSSRLPKQAGATAPVTTSEAQVNELEMIRRAKREWEGTVDALGDIVCLLGDDGRVLRANRAVERWGLGDVEAAIGRSAHGLLHPGCSAPRCPLARTISTAWKALNGKPAEFEYASGDPETVWSMALWPLKSGKRMVGLGGAYAALIVSDVSEFRRARAALEALNSGLESRVRIRTRELADANRDLRNEVARREAAEQAQREALRELERLSGALITAQENERRRIAVELHDSVGQSLTAVKYSIERAMEMLRRSESAAPLPVLELSLDNLRQAAESIHSIAMNLRPTVLDDMGAVSAVAWLCRNLADVYPSIRIGTELKAVDGEVPERLGTAIFRSTQELLNNVAKHAQATETLVALRREASHLVLEVRDNGIGMPESLRDGTRVSGNGLRNLRERAGMTGGRFTISRVRPCGTIARISWLLMRDELAAREAEC